MKHISSIESAGDSPVKVLTRRALAKQQTRVKVLAAARSLFSAQGYEGATIRDIAAEAGMSTGAVFANFTDKSDLFREILFSDMDTLIVAMRAAAAEAESTDEGLLKIFMVGYAFYKGQMPLARAAFSVSWAADEGHALRTAPLVRSLQELISGLIDAGARRGELVADPETELRTQMIYDMYLSNFGPAIFQGLSLETLEDRTRGQIRVLLDGARRI